MEKNNEMSMIIKQVLVETNAIEEIAKKIGKTYPTLMREINPYDKNAKLGAETLLEIMKITNDTRPLEYLAEEFGWKLSIKNTKYDNSM